MMYINRFHFHNLAATGKPKELNKCFTTYQIISLYLSGNLQLTWSDLRTTTRNSILATSFKGRVLIHAAGDYFKAGSHTTRRYGRLAAMCPQWIGQ